MAAAASSSASPEGGKAQRRDTRCPRVLLEMEGYVADCSNATTAWSQTSTGAPIYVSFCISRPPVLSNFFVHSPVLDLAALPSLPPKAICSDADLVLLRVPLDPDARSSQWHSDYFVYTMHPRRPKLDLLPNPRPARFVDDEIAVLSSGGGGYVVAALKVLPSFELHLYRSGGAGGGKPGTRRWTIQEVSVEAPLRSTVCPIPDSAENKMFHTTAKTIVIGGEGGTVGWVDLWRGILLCDVLSPEIPHKLRDIPLPLPARGNWENFLNYPRPCFFRDVAVDDRRETIKYVEMEITLPEHVPVFPYRPEPATFVEWVERQRQEECEQPESYTLEPGSWTATTYSLPIPVGSWKDWRRDSSVRSAGLKLPDHEDAKHYELLQKLISSSSSGSKEEANLALGCLNMAYPTIVVGDGDGEDTVYLMSTGIYRGSMEAVLSVDVKAGALQGVAKLERQMHAGFKRCCLASEISKYTRTVRRVGLVVDGGVAL